MWLKLVINGEKNNNNIPVVFEGTWNCLVQLKWQTWAWLLDLFCGCNCDWHRYQILWSQLILLLETTFFKKKCKWWFIWPQNRYSLLWNKKDFCGPWSMYCNNIDSLNFVQCKYQSTTPMSFDSVRTASPFVTLHLRIVSIYFYISHKFYLWGFEQLRSSIIPWVILVCFFLVALATPFIVEFAWCRSIISSPALVFSHAMRTALEGFQWHVAGHNLWISAATIPMKGCYLFVF